MPEFLKDYISNQDQTLLVRPFDKNLLNAVYLSSTILPKDLRGHYEGMVFDAPEWYYEIMNSNPPILVIENIDEISNYEQMKFNEIIASKRIGSHKLPDNILVILTAQNFENVNKEILVQVKIVE